MRAGSAGCGAPDPPRCPLFLSQMRAPRAGALRLMRPTPRASSSAAHATPPRRAVGAWTDEAAALRGAADGPLAGLTFAVKEMFPVAGLVTRFGVAEWAAGRAPAAATHPAVAALVAAGATLSGRTVMDALAYSLAGDAGARPENPSAPGRLCGGSSSGAAAAVAARDVDFALGTDTGGSIRVPASYTGLFGFRPSHGRVSLAGCPPLAPSFDTAGWFARDVRVLERVGSVVLDSGPPPTTRLSRWLVAGDAFALAEEEAAKALYEACARAKDALIARLSPPVEANVYGSWGAASVRDAFRVAQGAEVAAAVGPWAAASPAAVAALHPAVAARLAWAATITDEDAVAAAAVRKDFAASVDALLGADGALFLPAAPGPAPAPADADAARNGLLELTCIAGLGGLPQVVLPAARVGDGSLLLPVGLGILGPRGSDEALLRLAVDVAAALGC